jgi:DNA-binding PadR family transcriptional regulator
MKGLTILEQIIIAAIICLKENAYGILIRKKAKEMAGKSPMYGTLYNILEQLYRKGYVTKERRKEHSLDKGHYRIYYQVTDEGIKSLQEAYHLQKSIWSSIPDIARDFEK